MVFLHDLRIHFLKIGLILDLKIVLVGSLSLLFALDPLLEAFFVKFELLHLVL